MPPKKNPPVLVSGRADGEPFEWFDDCAVCQYMKTMEEEGREPTMEELQAAFRLAKAQGAQARETIAVSVSYSESLQKITGVATEVVRVPEGSNTAEFLQHVWARHPAVFRTHEPGALGFLHNGRAPGVSDTLQDGDRYEFTTAAEQRTYPRVMRKEGRSP